MITSSAPMLLQINSKTVHFMADTGTVDKVSKRVETQFNASASGGGVQQFGRTAVVKPTTLNVSSSNTTVTELWMRNGDKELDHTFRSDLSLRESQKVSIIMVAKENERTRHYVGVINHNTGTWQPLNTLEHLVDKTIMPKLSTALYVVLIGVAFCLWFLFENWVPTALALAGIVYLSITRSNKMREAKSAFDSHITEVKQLLTANN